jgi:hypothetical protein
MGDSNYIMSTAYLGNGAAISIKSIFDVAEIFNSNNNRDLTLDFDVTDQDLLSGAPVPSRMQVRIANRTNNGTVKVWPAVPEEMRGQLVSGETSIRYRAGQNPFAELAPFLAEFRNLSEAIYIGPFRNAINVGTNEDYFDMQVGASFIGRWRTLKTGNNKRANELTMKVTDDIARIFEFDRLQIDASEDGQTLQIYINGKSFKLPELGSGLAQFIIVLANAAIRQPSYVLIDEPELNLHPSLMLDFLTTLGSYARCGVVFCTHNIGLARAAATESTPSERYEKAKHILPNMKRPRDCLSSLGR